MELSTKWKNGESKFVNIATQFKVATIERKKNVVEILPLSLHSNIYYVNTKYKKLPKKAPAQLKQLGVIVTIL